jgi:2-hydroxy-3-keto-5-methylthiopentenyl-1-phosphate phosphatase
VSTGLKLFLDFDGTIACGDVGNAFFRRFGGDVCAEWISRYHDGGISARACFEGEREAMGRVRREEADAFLETCAIDSGFSSLIAFCRGAGLPVAILSDGLDFYIKPLLLRSGHDDLPCFSNRLEWGPVGDDGRVIPVLHYPFGNAECDRCACCKRNIMLGASGEDDIIAYVGDGYSDRCPVEYADVVFAKGDLQAWCQRQNISYFPYHDLHDVRRRLEELMQRRSVRRRPRAEQRRREAFASEA